MDDQNPSELLKLQLTGLAGRTAFCPEDQQIAEYFDGSLSEREAEGLERHLADCRYCLARVGMLQRLEHPEFTRRIPEDVLLAAKTIQREPVRRFRLVPLWAGAAALLALAVSLAYLLPPVRVGQVALPRDHSAEPGTPLRETRSIAAAVTGPRFLTPAEGSTVVTAEQPFTWTAVPDSLYYQLRIVSGEGDLLWQQRLEQSEWIIPAGLALVPGEDYFVRVDAFLTDSKSLPSDYLLFRLEEGR